MKKVGIITIHGILNYGSVLQTYATYRKVSELGYDAAVIDYTYPDHYHLKNSLGNENKKGKLRRFCLNVLIFLRLFNVALIARNFCFWIKRNRFMKKMIMTKRLTKANIAKKTPIFDIYLTGSDQTWNPRYLCHDYTFLLDFAPECARRVSYAASFGANTIDEDFKQNYSVLLAKYAYISVREASGVLLVKELCKKQACHVVDPTMLLSAEQWKQEITSKSKLPEKFVFCYCMDYVFDPFPQMLDLLKHLSTVLNMPVLFWSDNKKHRKIIKDADMTPIHGLGPEEFLEIYDKASFVVSNSFHGVAFAINFQKDFFAVLNPNQTKDDRVKDCLNTFGLENRGLNLAEININDIKIQNIPTDHSESQKRLNKLRDDSISYLAHALKGDDHAE